MASKKQPASSAPPGKGNSNSLLVLVLDASPVAWGERDIKRTALDRRRKAEGKGTRVPFGPAILEEVVSGILAFCNAVSSLERDAAVIVVAVAENEVATVFPRKNHLAQWMRHPDSYSPDIRNLKEHILTGIAELIERAAVKQQSSPSPDPSSREAAIAAGFSTALCILNRLLVAAKAGGVSALPSQHYMDRVDDQGVVAMMDSSSSKQTSNRPASAWSPRILLVQASEDRSQDYNAIMNCAFAANKNHVTVDGCFLTAGSPGSASSSFLEQVCDLTGGIYSAPSGMSQIGGALTEVLLSVFLAPLPSRDSLHLPTGHKVDFRARCFESAAIVDRAFVCNQCLSIFRQKPTQLCPTCQAKIVESKRK